MDICVSPLSPTYTPLSRLLTSLLLFSGLYNQTPHAILSNVLNGSLAAALTRSSIVALHAIVLLALQRRGAQDDEAVVKWDADWFGTWSVLSLAVVMVPGLLAGTTGRRKRMIVRCWGVLVIAGGVCSYVGLRRAKSALGLADVGADVEGMERANRARSVLHSRAGVGEGSCSAVWALWGLHQGTLVSGARLFNDQYKASIDRLAIAVLIMAAVGAIRCVLNRPTIKPQPAAGQQYDREAFLMPISTRQDTEVHSSTGGNALRSLAQGLSKLFTFASPVLFIVVLVFNELFLFKKPALPTSETLQEVGQWGSWAAIGLVFIAAVIGKAAEEPPKVQTYAL